MQDRFKFRYHFDNKIWDVSEIDFDNQTLELKVDAFEAIHIKDFKYENLVQCTGLKDKNGKLIFEGDICIYDFEEIGKQKAVIYFNNTYAGFMVKPLRNFQCTNLNNCEIIGNIYENQELLEVKGE